MRKTKSQSPLKNFGMQQLLTPRFCFYCFIRFNTIFKFIEAVACSCKIFGSNFIFINSLSLRVDLTGCFTDISCQMDTQKYIPFLMLVFMCMQ